ncbi:uncharacterized protein [Drosophila virilis]|uniref:uncharacterized protein n=1 Tax=Drosophila virilis TaxID=7244 RepID=UPI0038B2B11C
MADLPADRLETSYPFMVTGVDYCGLFFYKSEVRNRPRVKWYISLLICFATNAVHLKDLSTIPFLNALKRFILTRNRPSRIWSDNATNFIRAKNELADLSRLFLCEEHRMLVCHITAIINSHPLLPLSEHPDDLDVLTPGHFLGTAPSSSYIVEPDLRKLNFNRLRYFQRVTYLQQVFWARRREEYLTLLQQRSKWRTPQPGFAINDVVRVKNENLPPLKWPLARV